MSACVCHPVCVRALVRGVRALVRVVTYPSCKHLQASASGVRAKCGMCVSSVCQLCLECVSYPSGEPLEVKLGMDE